MSPSERGTLFIVGFFSTHSLGGVDKIASVDGK